ncbi:hypothetical protein NE237_000843 [Protea cynaroides]|uniref:HTH OST-type domain-containing protein n=1 Tax=Protea cynaroides TaxID=273540 RepID=A0A9Q0KS63_9MAGN|nr:hypothetical protein NE237_000843 [Protea cynaroides]
MKEVVSGIQELLKLLVNWSGGIFLGTFEATYQQQYKKALNYKRFGVDELEELIEKDRTKEPVAAHSVMCSVAEEPSDSNGVNKAPIDGKVESGSITFNFDSPTTSTREDRPHNADDQQCLQTLPGGLEDGKVDSLTTSSRIFFNEQGHGESRWKCATILLESQQPGYNGSPHILAPNSFLFTLFLKRAKIDLTSYLPNDRDPCLGGPSPVSTIFVAGSLKARNSIQG